MSRHRRNATAAGGGTAHRQTAAIVGARPAVAGSNSTVLVWLVAIVTLLFTVWLGVLAIQAAVVPSRLAATFAGLLLLALQVGFPLQFGPPNLTIVEKWKSLGADLAVASVSFDVTMYLGNVPLSDLGPIKITNPAWFYLIAGVSTMFLWILWLYPSTSGRDKPSNLAVYASTFVGIILYFGRVLVYVLRG